MVEFAATLYAVEKMAEWTIVWGFFALIAVAGVMSMRKPKS